MVWTPFSNDEKREGFQATLSRMRELKQDKLAGALSVLEKYENSEHADWREVAAEVCYALGDLSKFDRDVAWAVLPLLVRAYDMRGGMTR